MGIGGKALIFPFILLVFVFASLGAAKFYLSYLDKEKIKIDDEERMELANLSGKTVDRIADFQDRMKLAAKEAAAKKDYNDYLRELESSLVKGVRVNSFTYSPEKVSLEMTADNLKETARQALSFKNSRYYKELVLGATSVGEEDKIEFGFSSGKAK